MKNIFSIIFLAVFLTCGIFSQPIFNSHGFAVGSKPSSAPKHSFDVLDYKLYLDIYNCFQSPYPKSYTANEIIKFRVDSALNSITLNAVNNSLIIDSVGMQGTVFNHYNNILSIGLNRVYQPGEIVTVKVFFRHKEIQDSAVFVENGFFFTQFQPEGARRVFPCWDKPSDKATFELHAKVPSSVKIGSNGKLADSLITGDTIYYHWVSRDPVATYLITVIGKLNYNLDIIYLDSLPIRFYWNNGENIYAINNAKQKSLQMTNYFSGLFGDYPFEKNGFASINSPSAWGGMENQTLINLCYGCWYEASLSHELPHQWFGDMVTCGTWADLWLNEGFATYSEALWKQTTIGDTAYKNFFILNSNYYLANNPGFPCYNPQWAIETPPVPVLLNYPVIYAKSACVLYMLRNIIGDSSFFNFISEYSADTNFRYKNVVTSDFILKFNQTLGQNFDWFFDEWIYQPNHPVYENVYNFFQNGNSWRVSFLARQTQTNTIFFKMPLELKIIFGAGLDTVVNIINGQNNQLFTFLLNKQPLFLLFDPGNKILPKQGTTSIGIANISSEVPFEYQLYQNYPNPFNSSTIIKFDLPKSGQTKITIYNIQGKEVAVLVNQKLDAGSYKTEWVAGNYPSGVYFFRIESGSFAETKKMVLVK